ncbi:uncharacterized protein Dvar_52270 [Desulfosarcina variabilis str. Montpellier]
MGREGPPGPSDRHCAGEYSSFISLSSLEFSNHFQIHKRGAFAANILSLCRPDQRKNIAGLIKAYGEDKGLQSMARVH